MTRLWAIPSSNSNDTTLNISLSEQQGTEEGEGVMEAVVTVIEETVYLAQSAGVVSS